MKADLFVRLARVLSLLIRDPPPARYLPGAGSQNALVDKIFHRIYHEFLCRIELKTRSVTADAVSSWNPICWPQLGTSWSRPAFQI